MAQNQHFTEADCAYCLKVINEDHPKTQEELAALERAGFPLEQVANDNAANRALAMGLLREYAPSKLNQVNTVSP